MQKQQKFSLDRQAVDPIHAFFSRCYVAFSFFFHLIEGIHVFTPRSIQTGKNYDTGNSNVIAK